MSRPRFRGRRSVLKPEWILDGARSGSTTPTATSENEFVSHSTSQIQSRVEESNDGSTNEPKDKPQSLDSIKEAEISSPIVSRAETALPLRSKLKSRYSKSYTSTWTIPSTSNDPETRKDTTETTKSMLKSWRRRFTGVKMSTDKPMAPPSPGSGVPPAPTQPIFPEDDVVHLRGQTGDNSRRPPRQSPSDNGTAPSPSSGADAPPKAPYIASSYTPTCSLR